jgi:hypothetical protein
LRWSYTSDSVWPKLFYGYADSGPLAQFELLEPLTTISDSLSAIMTFGSNSRTMLCQRSSRSFAALFKPSRVLQAARKPHATPSIRSATSLPSLFSTSLTSTQDIYFPPLPPTDYLLLSPAQNRKSEHFLRSREPVSCTAHNDPNSRSAPQDLLSSSTREHTSPLRSTRHL